jgi:hypothetical protein
MPTARRHGAGEVVIMKNDVAARSRGALRSLALALLGASVGVACAAASDANLGKQSDAGSGGTGGTGMTTATTTSAASSSSGEGGSLGLGGGDGLTKGDIYVHSLDTLYHFEPIASELTVIGAFDCILGHTGVSNDSGMQDIAVDKGGAMYGVAKVDGQSPGSNQDHIIVSIDKASGHCQTELVVPKTLIDPKGSVEVRGLSFIPQETLDGGSETLVGLEITGHYLRIDLANKSVGLLGSLNGNGPATWHTKGADIVSIIDDRTYVTAMRENEATDSLAVMNPKTGAITQGYPKTSLTTIGGLAYWGGTLYAFTVEGKAYSIDPKTGVETEIVVHGAPVGVQYHGAGVTTAAPIVIPN